MKLVLTAILAVLFLCVEQTRAFYDDNKATEVRRQILNDTLLNLSSPDPDIREGAKLHLMRPSYYNELRPYSMHLIPLLADYQTSPESAAILGLLDLPPSIVTNLLVSARTPDQVKARLGDREAEKRVIERFHQAVITEDGQPVVAHFETQWKATDDLLYVGSRNTMTVFAKALESEASYINQYGSRTTYALDLLERYGRVFWRNSLFNTFRRFHDWYTPNGEFLAAAHEKYLRDVEKHFKEVYGIEIHIRVPRLIDVHRRQPEPVEP